MYPTIFVDFESWDEKDRAIEDLFKAVLKILDYRLTTTLVDEKGVEVKMVFTNSSNRALSVIKDTESAMIVIVYHLERDGVAAESLASRFPKRVRGIDFKAETKDGQLQLTRFLISALKTEKY